MDVQDNIKETTTEAGLLMSPELRERTDLSSTRFGIGTLSPLSLEVKIMQIEEA
jgi:hypothetical protein